MKLPGLLLFALLLIGCNEVHFFEPPKESSLILVNVHWQNKGVAGIPVVLLQTGDSVTTGANGLAVFSVPAGHCVVRAYGINRGGPVSLTTDFDVEARPGEVATVDIVDCLPCL
jgi:hypothetical protein